MKMYLIDVKNEIVGTVDVNDDLQEYYNILGVSTIDIVMRRIGDRVFDIICDDEGMFNEPVKISAVSSNEEPMLVGNLLFAHHDKEGNMVGLSDEDLAHLRIHTGVMFTEDFQGGYPVMGNCDYV